MNHEQLENAGFEHIGGAEFPLAEGEAIEHAIKQAEGNEDATKKINQVAHSLTFATARAFEQNI